MGIYKYIKKYWRSNDRSIWKSRMIIWRKEPSVVKIERPTRLDRARALGYKAKTGFVIARVHLARGGRKRDKIKGGRRPRHFGSRKIVNKSYQQIAEERANSKFINLEVLNSYLVAKDGKIAFFEVILVDPERPEIKNDPRINWICTQTGRAYRGLTSAGRKSRNY